MLKKVVLGTVFAVFIGALITGAVIRTMDKSHQTTTEVRAGGGNDRNTSLENTSNTENQGNGQGRGRSTEDQDQARGGKGSEGSRVLTEEESDHLWEAYSGIVIEVSEEIVTIETREGEWIVVEGRAWSYAQEQGYYMQQGDQVQFEGFYENGEFKVSKLENLTTGESIVIRDASGRPSWAGGGWGNL